VEATGSIGQSTGAVHAAAFQPSETDLAYARAVAADALARGAKGNSVPWQNPQTGAGGNITPLASSSGAGECRDFLASYVRGSDRAWLQGSACRSKSGEWEVKDLKPLKSGCSRYCACAEPRDSALRCVMMTSFPHLCEGLSHWDGWAGPNTAKAESVGDA